MSEQRTPTQLHASIYCEEKRRRSLKMAEENETIKIVEQAINKALTAYEAEITALRAENKELRETIANIKKYYKRNEPKKMFAEWDQALKGDDA